MGQVISLLADYFGESGEDFNKIIKLITKEAAAGDYGRMISPLVNNNKKGGVFPIMLQQFRRAVALTVTCGNAYHKMTRLHYVRATPRQAKEVVLANLSNNKYTPGKRDYSWFAQHKAPGCHTFQQFRNGYKFCVH